MTADVISFPTRATAHHDAPVVRACNAAPDFRYSREPLAPTNKRWRVVVRVYGSPAHRDDDRTIHAPDEAMARFRALGAVRREQHVEGRDFLPALQVIGCAELDPAPRLGA